MCGGMDDLAGNKTTETNAKGTMTYAYDKLNRLKTVTDAYNKVISCTVKKSDNGYTAEVTNYQYDRQNVILETDASSNIKARYIRGINYIASMNYQNNETDESYFLYNGHGDVVQTVDEAGTIKNQYDYDIWGNPTLTVETTPNAIRYAGEFLDNETGLYYLRARYYDPYTGRFTTEDSYWGEEDNPLSLNRYTYCENDPIQYVDPTGHVPIFIYGIIQDVDSSEVAEAEKAGGVVVTPGMKFWGEIDNFTDINEINLADGFNSTVNNHNGSTIGTVNTGTGSTTTINNYGTIYNTITGNNSNTTINNRGIIDTIKVGENGTAEINNYNYIKNIIGGAITDDSKKGKIGMNIVNRGTIDYVLTGSDSHNVIDNEGGHLTLETGEGNETVIIGGHEGTILKDGKGKIYLWLYNIHTCESKKVFYDKSEGAKKGIEQLLEHGWSFNKPVDSKIGIDNGMGLPIELYNPVADSKYDKATQEFLILLTIAWYETDSKEKEDRIIKRLRANRTFLESNPGKAITSVNKIFDDIEEVIEEGTLAIMMSGMHFPAVWTELTMSQRIAVETREINALKTRYSTQIKLNYQLFAKSGGTIRSLKTSELNTTHSITMSKNKFKSFVEAIKSEGIKEPIKYVVHNGQKYVVDGHHRLQAAKQLGIKDVPVQKVELPYAGYKTVDDLFWGD